MVRHPLERQTVADAGEAAGRRLEGSAGRDPVGRLLLQVAAGGVAAGWNVLQREAGGA